MELDATHHESESDQWSETVLGPAPVISNAVHKVHEVFICEWTLDQEWDPCNFPVLLSD